MTRRPLIVAALVVACLAAGAAWSTRAAPYADRVAEMCRATDDAIGNDPALTSGEGGYFAVVQNLSHHRATRLRAMAPPPEHDGLHRSLLAGEAELNQRAGAAVAAYLQQGSRMAAVHFGPVRELELVQDRRYGELGAAGCSD